MLGICGVRRCSRVTLSMPLVESCSARLDFHASLSPELIGANILELNGFRFVVLGERIGGIRDSPDPSP